MNHIVSLREAISSLYLSAKCCNGYDTVAFLLAQLPGDSQTGQKSVDYFGRQTSGRITYGTIQGNLRSAAFNILLISPSSFENQPELDTKQPQLATHDWAPAASTNFREIFFFPWQWKVKDWPHLNPNVISYFSQKEKRNLFWKRTKVRLRLILTLRATLKTKWQRKSWLFKFGYVVELVIYNRLFSWVLVGKRQISPGSISDK